MLDSPQLSVWRAALLSQPALEPLTYYADIVLATQPAALLAYWKLNETSGTAIADSTGNTPDATAANVTLGVPGSGGGFPAIRFNGTTSYIDVYSPELSTPFNAGNAGTIAAKAKVSGGGVLTDATEREIIRLLDTTGGHIFIRKTATANTIQVVYNAGGVSKSVSTNTLTTTDWFHIAATWDLAAGATGELKLFLDGAQVGSTVVDLGTWSGSIDANNCNIGAASKAGAEVWDGDIDEVPIWDVALTPTEIAALAAA